MKIICVDNFARDTVSDYLVADNVKSEQLGKAMVDGLNTKFGGEHSPSYFKLVPADHKLYVFEP